MDNDIRADLLAEAAAKLDRAQRVVAVTGSGMSRESGIPTFREAQTGLWAQFPPEELATPEAFAQHPARVFGWYMWRRHLVDVAVPHAGHHALAAMVGHVPCFDVVTQNVDGLHQRAGCPSVIELHGSLCRFRCGQCGGPGEVEPVAGATPTGEVDPPQCTRCSGRLRPDVVWFGEPLPATALDAAWKAASHADVMLVVGTSGLVYPAASVPVVGRRSGAYIVEVNPDRTELSSIADVVLRGPAGVVLPRLLAEMESSC